ncbi:MAG TPA: MBL fold metallo-hydrolase [Reyranella sp.]|nr:MBL fold metallo-hydrolase [Reyranella sp.]
MARPFADQADTAEKTATFSRLSEHAYAFTTEGDPNTGVIVGDDAVMVIDSQPTPKLAQAVIEKIRSVTDKAIRYVVLSGYHGVRTLGASAYEGAQVISSEATREMIVERGAQELKSTPPRLPRLFKHADLIPGLTWPTITFGNRMTLWLGKLQVELIQPGRGATKGDAIAWLPEERILFSGALVTNEATPYAGDAHFKDWPATLQKLRELRPETLLPSRGDPLAGEEEIGGAIAATEAYVRELFGAASAEANETLKQAYDKARAELAPRYGKWDVFDACLPFNVSRAWDEAKGLDHPRVWTVERDRETWAALEGEAAAA